MGITTEAVSRLSEVVHRLSSRRRAKGQVIGEMSLDARVPLTRGHRGEEGGGKDVRRAHPHRASIAATNRCKGVGPG